MLNAWLIPSLKETKLFWKVYFWWAIRQARKERLQREAKKASRKPMDTDEYWEDYHARQRTD